MSILLSDQGSEPDVSQPSMLGCNLKKCSTTDQSTQTPCLLTQLESFDESTRFLELSFSDFQVLESFARRRLDAMPPSEIDPEWKEAFRESLAAPVEEGTIIPKTEDVPLEGIQDSPEHARDCILGTVCPSSRAGSEERDFQTTLTITEVTSKWLMDTFVSADQCENSLEKESRQNQILSRPQIPSQESEKAFIDNNESEMVDIPTFPFEKNVTNIEIKSEVVNCESSEENGLRSAETPHSSIEVDESSALDDANLTHSFHKLSHTGERPFQCPQCEKKFTRQTALACHLRTHTGEKPFNCPECKKEFTKNSHLIRHLHTHTGEKPFQCPQCTKRFTTNQQLTYHLHTHTGEKPFSCLECEKKFVFKWNLNQHTQQTHLAGHLHTREKPFKCPECTKGFTTNQKLKHHLLTHTGEKPFSCSECNKKFPRKDKLNRHLLTHKEKHFQCSKLQ